MDPVLLTLAALGLVLVGSILPGVGLDLVAVLALALLVIGGVLSPEEAAHGFGNTTLLVVACMFILAEALQHTGAVQIVSRVAGRAGQRGLRTLFGALLPLVMVLSALMNNTGIVVLFLPVFLVTSRDIGEAPSRLLLPLSYAAILGGTMTLVGTTTNLLVDGIVRQEGHEGFALLDFLPVGAVYVTVGFLYLVLMAPRRLPQRVGLSTLVDRSLRTQYLTELLLGEDSALVGTRLEDDPDLLERIRFLALIRGEETMFPPFADVVLQPGDLLLVKAAPEDIAGLLRRRGILGPPASDRGGRIQDVNLDLAEVLVPPGSGLDGATVRQARLRDRFGVTVLGVLRRGEHVREDLGSLRLRIGDTLLVQGAEDRIARLAEASDDVLLVGGPPPRAPRKAKAVLATVISAAALGLAAVGVVALPVAVLLGSVALVVGGCISSGRAYRSVELRILVILGCMLGVGHAVQTTGIARDVADALVTTGSRWGPMGLLAAIYLATMILTELVTNAGTATIMTPIALSTAELAGVSYLPFVMAVALAASCSFLTPVGYQTNLLVYGPGGYRFLDYARFGLPLSLLLWVTGTLMLPLVFPF